jgi:hypothetical protein
MSKVSAKDNMTSGNYEWASGVSSGRVGLLMSPGAGTVGDPPYRRGARSRSRER